MHVAFDDGTELWLGSPLLTKIYRYIEQNGANLEAGGVLIGTRSTDGMIYEVTDITLPSLRDTRHRFMFVRSMLSANRLIKKAWCQSAGKKNYLGEWHTHDEWQPSPSNLDRQAAIRLAKDGPAPFGCIFLIIFGNSNNIYAGRIDSRAETGFAEKRVIVCRE